MPSMPAVVPVAANPTSSITVEGLPLPFSVACHSPLLFPTATPAAEVELVCRLVARDETAMRAFYDHYGRTLYRLIRALVANAESAEDVLQESMVKIWHHFPRYDPARGRLYTWAVNICRNQAIDHLRQAQARGAGRTRELTQRPGALQFPAPDGFAPEHMDVHACLAYLRPAYQRVLQLRFFDGFKLEEVAELLDLPLGTVKTRQRQALRQLAGLWA